MVEATDPTKQKDQQADTSASEQKPLSAIEEELQAEFRDLVKRREELPISDNIDNGNMIIRTHYEEKGDKSKFTVVTEVKRAKNGLLPSDFQYFIENWADCCRDINPLVVDVKHYPDVEGYGVSRSTADAPWPLAQRVSYAARYIKTHMNPDEH